jgi:hypothetical protein
MLREYEIAQIFDVPDFDPCLIGKSNLETIATFISTLRERVFEGNHRIDIEMPRLIEEDISK